MALFKQYNLSARVGRFLRSWPGTVFKLTISAGVILYFILSIDLDKIHTMLLQVSITYLLILLAALILRNIIAGIRFYFLVRFKQVIGIWILTKLYFITATFNLFLPTSIGGDVVRVFYLSRYNLSKADSAMFIIVERLIGFFTLLLFSCIASFFMGLPPAMRLIIYLSTSGYFIMMVLVFLTEPNKLVRRLFGNHLDTFLALKSEKFTILMTLLFSFIYQFVSIMVSYIVARAFHLDIPMVVFLVFIPLVWFFTMLPISFGGLGVREAATVYLFSFAGITMEDSLVISLGTYLALVLTGAIGALLFIQDRLSRDISIYRRSAE